MIVHCKKRTSIFSKSFQTSKNTKISCFRVVTYHTLRGCLPCQTAGDIADLLLLLELYFTLLTGKFVSINLQKTKHHKNTDMVIHSNIDVVMEAVCKQLGVVIPQVSKPQVVLHSIHSDIKSCVPIDVSIDPVILTSCKSSLGNGSESHRSLSDDVTNFATRKRMKEEIDVKDMKKLKPDPL